MGSVVMFVRLREAVAAAETQASSAAGRVDEGSPPSRQSGPGCTAWGRADRCCHRRSWEAPASGALVGRHVGQLWAQAPHPLGWPVLLLGCNKSSTRK